jgi:hypothetical protein
MATSTDEHQLSSGMLRQALRQPDPEHEGSPSLGSTSRHGCERGEWRIVVCLGERLVTREVIHGSRLWLPEVIWPTWPATPSEEAAASASPLGELQQYWATAGNRLRESAKWMAAVLGAALASVVGTSPLTSHHLHAAAAVVGLTGLVFLSITMLLIVQVMRPQAVSYSDIQHARAPRWIAARLHRFAGRLRHHSHFLESPLYRWRETIESHQDLYLPCGVTSLTGLRQSMIIEEVTLMALAQAREGAPDTAAVKTLSRAQAARTARLLELRVAAAKVVTVGEYYKLRTRSARATYGGIACSLIGIAAIVAAFSWPIF